MKSRFIGAGLILAGALASQPAFALKMTVAPAQVGYAGQPQTFRVAGVTEAVGTTTVQWKFSPESDPTEPTTSMEITHVYPKPGHYRVFAYGFDDSSKVTVSFNVTIVNPLTKTAPTHSTTILLDTEKHKVWNVNQDSDTVSITDEIKLTRDREVPVGHKPRALAQAPDKTIWVTNQDSDEVVVLNRDTGAIETRIPLPFASQPWGIAFGPGGTAYVALYAIGKVVEIDGSSRKLGRELALGPTPAGVSVASDGRVFVTRFISPADHGEIWAIAPQAFKLDNTIKLPFDMTMDTQSSGRGVPNDVFSMVISPDGTQAWVTAKKDDVARGPQRDGKSMTSDNFVRTALCKIDMKTETEVIEAREDVDNRSLLADVEFSPLGDYAFVIAHASNWFGIYDGYTLEQLNGIKDVGHGPDGAVLTPQGQLIVNAFLSRELLAYDVSATLDSTDHVATEPKRVKATDKDLLLPRLVNGKQIFYNSADERMGHAGYWSCASCHYGGISDGRIWDFTDRGEGLRNTKTLRGIRGNGEGRIHWSANMDEIQDLERDIRHDFEGKGFMPEEEFNKRKGADGAYDTFGKPAAGANVDLDDLAAYITSLAKVDRSPFRNPDGSFTKDALAGRKVFEKAGCPACHNGADFTDSATGVMHDVGTLKPSSALRLYKPIKELDTPSLKGAWQSAPYLHDGRAATLTEVFTTYNKGDGMGVTSNLSSTEIAQLVAYVEQLDDEPVTEAKDTGEGATGMAGCSVGGSRSRSAPYAGIALALCALAMARRRNGRGARPS